MVNIFFGIIVTVFVFTYTEAKFFRFCKNAEVDKVRLLDIHSKFASEVVFDGNSTRVNLKVNVSWEVDIPDDVKIDGFLIRFLKHSSRGNSIPPVEECLPGDNLWVTKSNATSCSNFTSSDPGCLTSSSEQCLCSIKGCPLLYGGASANCKGSDNWVKNKGFISIQPHVRSLTFKIAFNSKYNFEIKPYYRENVGSLSSTAHEIDLNPDCIELLRRDSLMSIEGAAETCCDAGVPHVIARNVTIGNQVPDFRRGTVNITVTWLPPINHAHLTGFYEHLSMENFSNPRFPKHTKLLRVDNIAPTDKAKCDKVSYYYQSTLYNLVPGESYYLQISSRYQQSQMSEYRCGEGLCRTEVEFKVPVFDVCKWGYCHEKADCVAQNSSGMKSMKAFCQCKPGFSGDGINTTWSKSSNGCVDADYCENKRQYCVSVATCIDNPAPQEGVTCRCPSDHYGDGYLSGSGCTPNSILGLKIGIPLTVTLTLLVVAIVWKARVYELYKKTFRFAKFSS